MKSARSRLPTPMLEPAGPQLTKFVLCFGRIAMHCSKAKAPTNSQERIRPAEVLGGQQPLIDLQVDFNKELKGRLLHVLGEGAFGTVYKVRESPAALLQFHHFFFHAPKFRSKHGQHG